MNAIIEYGEVIGDNIFFFDLSTCSSFFHDNVMQADLIPYNASLFLFGVDQHLPHIPLESIYAFTSLISSNRYANSSLL